MKNAFSRSLFHPRHLIAIFAGLLLALAFPNAGIAGLAWIAPGLMIVAALGTRGAEAFRIGYVAGLAQWLASLTWLLNIPVNWFPLLGWVALSAFLAFYTAVWVWFFASRSVAARRGPGSSAESQDPILRAVIHDLTNALRGIAGLPWSQRALLTITGAAAWVAMEMIRLRFLSGFPWIPLGAAQYKLVPLIQIASVTGVYGVSFLVVWGSLSLLCAVAVVVSRPAQRSIWMGDILLPLTTVVIVFAFGLRTINSTPSPRSDLKVAFIQPSIPQTMIWDSSAGEGRFRRLIELTERALADKPDLLLWPEAAVPVLDNATYSAITNLVATHRVWMIFTADDAEPKRGSTGTNDYDFFNTAFLFNPEGQYASHYQKRRLVIFGEYIPLAEALPFVKWLTPITGSFTPGKVVRHFEMKLNAATTGVERGDSLSPSDGERAGVKGPPNQSGTSSPSLTNLPTPDSQRADLETGVPIRIKSSALICFEDTFPHWVREHVDDDTDFLVNLTNDAWFGRGSAQWQQAATAVFRAVENGVPLLRCCNDGITCWMDAQGRMRDVFRDNNGSVFGAGFMTAQIPVHAPGQRRERTFYNRRGDWFGWGCVGLATTAAFLTWRCKRSARS